MKNRKCLLSPILDFDKQVWYVQTSRIDRSSGTMRPLKSLCILAFLFTVLLLQLSFNFDPHLPIKTSNTSAESQSSFKVNQTVLKEFCKQKSLYLKQEVFRKNFENWLLIHSKYKIAYCHLAKVGSTAWKTILIQLVSDQEMQDKLLQMDTNELHYAINPIFSSKINV